MTESHAQAIKRICVKWRNEQHNTYLPITSLINRLQKEERNQKWREGHNKEKTITTYPVVMSICCNRERGFGF